MARIDKYDGVSGGFRAKLAFAIAAVDVGVPKGVSLDANGRVILGGAVGAVRGVICPSSVAAIGDPIDVMTDGEIVDVALAGVTAGEPIHATAATGVLTDVSASNQYVGHMVEAWRLVVRVAR